jgi:hypothetical protein
VEEQSAFWFADDAKYVFCASCPPTPNDFLDSPLSSPTAFNTTIYRVQSIIHQLISPPLLHLWYPEDSNERLGFSLKVFAIGIRQQGILTFLAYQNAEPFVSIHIR